MADLEPILHFLESQKTSKENGLIQLHKVFQSLDLKPNIPVITITGTNGKGSAAQALSTQLIQAGYRVGTFTSPHLISYTERICLQLEPISEDAFLAAFESISKKTDVTRLNFFSLLFLMALEVFKSTPLDFLVLEVGVGGRLDATNILDADILILTQVALDHTQLLGKTREAIGAEKVGLARKNQIFICGDPNPPATVTDKALSLQCKSFYLNKHFGFFEHEHSWDLWLPGKMFADLKKPDMHPISLACATLAFTQLTDQLQPKSFFIPPARGRQQHFHVQGREIILDVAHNPAATQHLVEHLKRLPQKPTYALFAVMEDKDFSAIIELMKPQITEWWLTDIPEERGAKAENLAKLIEGAHVFHSTEAAWKNLMAICPKDVRILVFGSFSVVGPIMKLLSR